LYVLKKGRSGECIPDCCFVPGVDCCASDVQLCHVEWDPRYGGTVSCVYSLMVNRFEICIAVQLSIKRKVIVRCFVVLVPLDVLEANLAWGLVDCAYYHIDYVPIGFKSDIGKALIKGTGGFNTFNKRMVVTAELDNPVWPSVTELKQVMKKPDDR
jgi:hypothetical protein